MSSSQQPGRPVGTSGSSVAEDESHGALAAARENGGQTFGRYQLVELIGRGGMAEVFRAVSRGLQGFERTFVIKRIRPDKSESTKLVQMFCDEARISALLDHPNIVQVYDFGQIDGAYFMAMEYLRGKDLATVMRTLRAQRGALAPSLAAFVAREVARALQHAHTATLGAGTVGIVHRDVTPSNIMLLSSGGVKILDFGIAKAAALARPDDSIARSGAAPSTRLQGKLAYLSPEQVRGVELDGRSDLFSLGVVLWEMIAGRRLFAGDNEFETMRNVLMQPIPEPSRRRAGVPATLDAILARALARERDQRYASAAEMADDLDKLLEENPCTAQAVAQLIERLFPEAAPSSAGPVARSLDGTATALGSSTTRDGGSLGAERDGARPGAPPASPHQIDDVVSATRSVSGSVAVPIPEQAGGEATAHDARPYGRGALAALGRPHWRRVAGWAAALTAIAAGVFAAGWMAFRGDHARDREVSVQASSTKSLSISK